MVRVSLSTTVAGVQDARVCSDESDCALTVPNNLLRCQRKIEMGVLVVYFDCYLLQLQPQLGSREAVDDLDKTDEKNYSAVKMSGSVTKPLHERQFYSYLKSAGVV